AERLLGEGDFVVVAKGQVMRLQAAYIEEREVRDLVARLCQGSRPRLQAATGTDGARTTGAHRLTQHLVGRLRRVK
ncbi:hypothetical protein ACFLYD_03780, partial [Chloroflexota bacterium]